MFALKGDELGVVLSFLSAEEVLRGGIYRTSREFWAVLCSLSHSWCPVLALHFALRRLPRHFAYAWDRVKVRSPQHVCGLKCVGFAGGNRQSICNGGKR